MTIKERILQEIEDSSPILLEEFLDFILFTKQRRHPQVTQPQSEATKPSSPKRQSPSQVKALKEWFENTEPPQTHQPFKSRIKAFDGLFDDVSPVSEDIDSDQAKWEYLKEKHNL